MLNLPFKEFDLFSIEEDGRCLTLQIDFFNKCLKLNYYDKLTKDFIVNIKSLEK